MPEPTAPRPDVPDDLLTLAADAIRRYDWDTGLSANPDVSKHQRREAAAVLDAVLPAHERQVRERVAAEIYSEARKWASNAQASSTVPERERRFAVAAALTKAATGVERGES